MLDILGGDRMRLIDADKLCKDLVSIFKSSNVGRKNGKTKFSDAIISTILLQPPVEPPTTVWVGSYSPYTCLNCNKHADSKTPYCSFCGRKAVNYTDENGGN